MNAISEQTIELQKEDYMSCLALKRDKTVLSSNHDGKIHESPKVIPNIKASFTLSTPSPRQFITLAHIPGLRGLIPQKWPLSQQTSRESTA